MSRSAPPKPYFERPSSDQDLRPLLLVSYHFPPSQAAGALRWQKFARYAAERGYRLDVLALDPDQLDRPDPSRFADLPPGTRAFGIPDPRLRRERIEGLLTVGLRRLKRRRDRDEESRPRSSRSEGFDPGPDRASDGHQRLGRGQSFPSPESRSLALDSPEWHPFDPAWLRRAYFAASSFARQARWARSAATLGAFLHGRENYEAVITCGPPHMSHEAGRRLHRRCGLPFAMDMRDPWSLQARLSEHVASPLWYALARRHEFRVAHEASLVICNTLRASEAMVRVYPEMDGRFLAVMNGFDHVRASPGNSPRRFTVTYAGSLYLDRDPTALFVAAARVVGELRLDPSQFCLQIIGDVQLADVPLEKIAAGAGLDPAHLDLRDFVPRERLMRLLDESSVLVSLSQDSDMSIPSKIFEYLCFPAWLLVMAKPESATGRILANTAADLVDPGDVDGTAAALRKRYLAFQTGERPIPLAAKLPHLSRHAQAQLLLDALERSLIPRRSQTAIEPDHLAKVQPER